MTMNANWSFPTAIRFGAGRISELAEACQSVGMKRPLLVTDPGIAALPMIEEVLSTAKSNGLEIGLFSNITANPDEKDVAAGVEVYLEGGYDGVVAFGGGSGLDAGKAIAFMAHQELPIWEFEDIGDRWTRANADVIPPIVAVPTTSGTGSEVGRASVITNSQTHIKKVIFHPKIMPSIVIADPELTVGLPKMLTAATGMDALAHCLEAFCAPGYHPMADGIAVEGIRMVHYALPRVVADPTDIEARGNMLVASSMGATAFQKGLGSIHALSHPFGGIYGAHHGALNGVIMPYVLTANRPVVEAKVAYLATVIGVEGFEGFYEWVLSLRSEIGIPNTLKDLGIDDPDFDRIGAIAIEDPTHGGNPIAFSIQEYADLAKRAYLGDLNFNTQ
jgi:alcohol dehydrogenase